MRILGTSHNLSWRRGGGGGEIVFYPKLYPDPYSIAPMFLGTPPPPSIMLKDLRALLPYIIPKW